VLQKVATLPAMPTQVGMTCPAAGKLSVIEVEPWLIGWLPADLLTVLSVLLMLWEHG
jgi:hypothetical protein